MFGMISYAGTPAISITYKDREEVVREGYRIIDYNNAVYGNSTEMPVIESNQFYTVYGNESLCKEPQTSDRSWIAGLNRKTGKNYTSESFIWHEVRNYWKY